MKEIHARGWTVQKVELKKGEYSASATNPSGKKVTKTGPDQSTALGSLLMAIMRREHVRSAAQIKVGMWGSSWVDQIQEIAEAYAKAPAYDPKAAVAWKELADDSVRRMEVLSNQIEIEVVDDPEPYSSPQEMCDDVHNKRKFKVSRANSDHPIWSVDENVAFRAVHDILGHCVSGGDFGWTGENQACAAHFPLLSPLAQQALFSECIAQTAYAQYYRAFGPQKIVLMPQFFGDAQYAENDVDHTGVPFEDSYAPYSMPRIDPSEPRGLELGTTAPHEAEEMGWDQGWYDYEQGFPRPPVISKTVNEEGEELFDPNHEWESTVEPAAVNAYLHHGNPLDWNQKGGVQDQAKKLQSDWFEQDESIGKTAVANALRAGILSPMKNLRWNAIQYQHLLHIPYNVTDPDVYNEVLNEQRVNWNVSKFGPDAADLHVPYRDQQRDFIALQLARNPDESRADVKKNAIKEVNNLLHNFEEALADKESTKDPEKRKDASQISSAAAMKVRTFLKNMLNPSGGGKYDVEHEQEELFKQAYENVIPENPVMPEGNKGTKKKPKTKQVNKDQANLLNDDKPLPFATGDSELYGGWMIQQMHNIAAVSAHIDEIYDAAIEDVLSGGKGHIFRAAVLHLDLPGVAPKVASFAWLLLMPETSQLAAIDTHMMDVLGIKGKSLTDREYFLAERQLRSRVNAMGYGSMPLGQAQWSLWDAKRTGVGTHVDHSALSPMSPRPHDQIEWEGNYPSQSSWASEPVYETDEEGNHILNRGKPVHVDGAPEWWHNTAEAGDLERELWMANQAVDYPSNKIPFKTAISGYPFPTFEKWWNKSKPIRGTQSNIKQLAAYAVINRMPKKKLTEFLDSHEDDFIGGKTAYKLFKKGLRQEIDKLQSPPGWKGSAFEGRPFYLSSGGDIVDGKNGDSKMKMIRRDLKLSSEDVWKLNLEVGRT